MIYELKAGGVDERRLVGAKLEKLAEGETGTLNRATKFFAELLHLTNTETNDCLSVNSIGLLILP